MTFLILALFFHGPEPFFQEDSQGTPKPERFAPGVISTELPEFAISFDPDGQTVYFNRTTANRDRILFLMSRRQDGNWQPPQPVPFAAAGAAEVDPFVTLDGKYLYFSSNRPKKAGAERGDFETWVVQRAGESWGKPKLLPAPANGPSTEVFVSLDRQGTLYFASDRHTGFNLGIFSAKPDNGGFAAPELITFSGQDLPASNPCIAPDGSFLVFSADLAGGKGETDLYVSFFDKEQWGRPQNIPLVNSRWAEFAPAIGPQEKYLYFTSERVAPGNRVESRPPGDIYRIPLRVVTAMR